MAQVAYETRMLAQKLCDAVREAGRGLRNEELYAASGARRGDQKVHAALDWALSQSMLIRRDALYCTPRQVGRVLGRLQRSTRGFGFVGDHEGDDLFIPPNAMCGAMHGDTVLCTIMPPRMNGKGPEGRVEKVVSHNTRFVVGVVDEKGRAPRLVPDEPKLCDAIFIDKNRLGGAKHGQRVVLEMRTYAEGSMPAYGAVVEILGDMSQKGVDITAILRSHGLFETFPEAVRREAEALDGARVTAQDRRGREDFRDLFTVTIDGRDSRDFDDAVSVEDAGDGITRLYVHIADVSHYVREGTALNEEAYARATSVYLPDRVCPMLPEELSNGICSLNQGQDRLCLTVIADINDAGRVVGSEICRGVICVNHRLVYEDVTDLLEGRQSAYDATLRENLFAMAALARRLHAVRVKRGSIDFDLSETGLTLDESGHAIDVYCKKTGVANQMIEEFMLIANETVAQYLDTLELPGIFRVHETPDPQKIRDFSQYLSLLGYRFPVVRGQITPRHLQQVASQVAGRDDEFAVNRMMLRPMQKARYASEDLGHFGLALQSYCHFTSPIRRYPDLIVHRVLTLHLMGQMDEHAFRRLSAAMDEMAEHCSERERNAMDAERDAVDLKKCEYIRDHLGQEYDAVISGVMRYGFYAELDNTVEGLVRVASLSGEYLYDEKRAQLVNNRTRKTFATGDRVRVLVAGADLVNRTVDFALHEDEPKK